WLEKLSKRLCQETILEEYQQKIAQQNNLIKNLEDKLQALEDELCYSQSQATTFLSVQQELFQKHHFTPQTAVRTVAVNVKIFRECDVAQPVPQPMPLPIVPKVEVPTHTTEIHGSTPVSSTPPIKVQVPQQKIPIPPVQQPAVPQTVASTRFVSNPMQPRAIITSPQRFVSVAPNVTMMKKEVPLVMSNSQPVRPRSYLAEKSQPPTKTSSQVIDLTDEESSNKKLLPASSTLVSLASNSVSKVNLPGLQNNQNVLLPLNGLFQMMPAAGPNNPQFSLSNPVQVQQVSRQTLVPTLPPNLLGPRTVAYIIPSNSGQINTIGRNVTNFVPGTNQRLQTLIVRVTNPGQVPPMGTVINSNARMPVLTQGLRTSGPKNSPIPSSVSDLVLFPRQPKHPAPFPALPEYRPNPQLKALPPKPSLKGSKAPNGIILSWNMSLLSLHAEVSNYQLFAYQEAPGPVNASLWKKVGDVKALPLPMACTLTQFVDGNRYYFTVRAVDVHNRFGPYSDAVSILFSDTKDNSKSLNK
ncbi:Activating transcription factor 7-interacting protein 1, partial [Araneus ventricosus]